MNTNIAAVSVLYNPNKEFLSNIKTYAEYVPLLILVDNSENPDHSFYDNFKDDPKIKLIIYHQNNGIAKALNDAISLASSYGFNWILTMDQDSSFENGNIVKYFSVFDQLPNKENIAAVGPLYYYNQKNVSSEKIKPVTELITSGAILNIAINKKLGGYDEKLFIDEVDHDYCYRAIINGYSIMQLQDIYLQHALGNPKNVTTISGTRNKPKSLHSPIRLYYIVRNSCYVISTYKKYFPVEMRLRRKDVLVRIKNNIIYGNNKLAVIKYIIEGYIDFKKNKFGKYSR